MTDKVNPVNLVEETQAAVSSEETSIHKKKGRHKKANARKNSVLAPSSEAPSKLNKSVINVIRTTQRNNIDLKHIADNKANILMSINALMITLLIPIILSNRELIIDMHYYIPLAILAITCLVTVILSALVLRPFSERGRVMKKMSEFREKSPFFFENYDRMEVEEYYKFFCDVSQDEENFFKYVIEDLHYYGKILSLKYRQVKHAYTGFIIGFLLTALTMLIVTLCH